MMVNQSRQKSNGVETHFQICQLVERKPSVIDGSQSKFMASKWRSRAM